MEIDATPMHPLPALSPGRKLPPLDHPLELTATETPETHPGATCNFPDEAF